MVFNYYTGLKDVTRISLTQGVSRMRQPIEFIY
jgi:hypothetical protein